MALTPKFFRRPRGFTFVEVLIAIAVIGTLGGVAYVNFTGAQEGTSAGKLENDVRVLNNAIDSYLAAGGSLTNATTAGAVLDKLKTVATAASAERTLGVTGAFVDPRTTIVLQTAAEGNSAVRRAFFTNSSPPRFFTASAGGVGIKEFAFDEVAAGAAAGTETRTRTLDQASADGWVWDYNDRTVAAAPAGLVPTAVDIAGGTTNVGQPVISLDPPTFSPVGGAYTLSLYPRQLSMDNPNEASLPGASRIYYSLSSSSGPYVLYSTPFNIDPDTQVWALCVSLDPSRYTSSSVATANYTATPLLLAISLTAPASVTYAQAGGAMTNEALQIPPSATVALTASVPSPYISSSNFNLRYTLNGTSPTNVAALQGPAFSGSFVSPAIGLGLTNFGTNTSINIQAAAVTLRPTWFTSSGIVQRTVTASQVALPPPTVGPPSQFVLQRVTVGMTNPNTGPATNLTIRYTTNNTAPTTNSTIYSTPLLLSSFGVNEVRTIQASTFPPTGLTNWFAPSPPVTVTYTGPNFAFGTGGGLLITGGTVANNATVNGNITIAVVTNGTQPNLTFNNNSALTGNVFVPGTPTVTGIPTNRVTNLNGPVNPTNYTITIQKADWTGTVFRRINPQPTLPTVTAPTGLTNRTGGSSGTLLPGSYTNVNPGNNATITLGISNSATPSIYYFDRFTTGNNARINVVGPVIVYVNQAATNSTINVGNGVVIGNVSRPEWLQLNVLRGNFTLGNNGTYYGSINNPTGTVTFENNSIFNGGVTARLFTLSNNGAGIVFSLPPPGI
jgi:prepilin-type N-terminal cleavage/methylation domain-containing protein